MNQQPQAKRRCDYQPPEYLIESVDLHFDLQPNNTRVKCISKVRRNGEHAPPLVLDGEQLRLVSVAIDGNPVTDFEVTDSALTLPNVPASFELSIETEIDPAGNTSLEGLYLSGGAYCTQCEAEGFRKITYFTDRPDVLAEYRVTVCADKGAYPYLLANGNKLESGDLDDGRHFVRWHDPFPKPSYLFALVAGDFDLLEDSFTTMSGRDIALQLFVDKGMAGRGQHALESLKKSMAWDEQTFGLEYDLDIYMIVAVDFFNMGAMENKGLNVFNSKFVLADATSATDEDYFNIESVIAHEYFHNWTGNRVTCRDWFQLSLKEGLTVFRDQQFSADMTSPVVNRIKNVRVIREHQFAEDASAMSHPIRPDEVIEMNNFYTVTVYDKGAEVIRMMHTLLGQQGFRKGMDLYFARFDGQAVTCDDFVQAMADANDFDMTRFKRWYGQSGTPKVSVSDQFDPATGEYQLTLEQINQPTADQAVKQDLHIPVKMELIDSKGELLALDDTGTTSMVYSLKERQQNWSLSGLTDKPVPVLLGDFSAPVRLEYAYSPEQLALIAQHAHDQFARWDAMQKLFSHAILALANSYAGTDMTFDMDVLLDTIRLVQQDSKQDPALCAEMLSAPSFETLCQQVERIDVDNLYSARNALLDRVATSLAPQWQCMYAAPHHQDYRYEQEQVNQRRLNNLCLSYLSRVEQGVQAVKTQYHQSDNMTDTLGALKAAQVSDSNVFDQLMQDFEQKWRHDPLVLDKWFGLHATTERPDILARLDMLAGHSQFSINNPNRVRALVGSFTFYNPMGFHANDGSGYKYVTDYLLKLDPINPQVAARLVTPLTQWQKLDQQRQNLIRHQLARLLNTPSLSKDLYEKVSKSLSFQQE